MLNIVFLVSGNGGTLVFTYNAIKSLKIKAKIVKVIADRECNAIDYANNKNIPHYILEKGNFENQLIHEIQSTNPNIIITNIHKILSGNIIDHFKGKFINLHYSLLPAFGGLIGMKTIENAKKQNCKFVGATVHKVTEEVDAGEIVWQAAIPVNWEYAKDIEDSTYKAASIILLQYIRYILSNKAGSTNILNDLNNNQVIFSPPIKNEDIYTDTSFWQKITSEITTISN